MTQPNRVTGGLINRDAALGFSFNGKSMTGHPGDTLASALLANGQKLVGRSFKYHRPRGIFTAGSEEPNALVQLRRGGHCEPNSRATVVELFEGLAAESQNHRPSLEFDLMAVNDLLSPFLSAGFYYKTFMWPKRFWERVYEPVIRASAGLGKLSMLADPDQYDKGFLHCDLLVIGAGPAGLSAALAAGRAGVRVIIADEDFLPGGRLNLESQSIDGVAGSEWAAACAAELDSLDNVRCMRRMTVFGAYDHGIFGAVERKTDHLAESAGKPRQILWRIYAQRSLVCTGATERAIAFGGNDRPNVMLAGAARGFLNRFGVAAGRRIAVFTNNDSGWRTAADFAKAGLDVAAIIDTRETPRVSGPGDVTNLLGRRVVATSGRKSIRSITLSDGLRLSVDCLAVSGGWSPNLQLTCHKRNRPRWEERVAAFVPGSDPDRGMRVAGAVDGQFTLAGCLRAGQEAGIGAAVEFGRAAPALELPRVEAEGCGITPFWHVAESRGRCWLDLQNDVTVKDVELSHREGFKSVEHLKRYTTLGMATDQGKTANVPALAIMASLTGTSIEKTGTTIYRPPYTPVSIGTLAGRSRGREFRPTRLTPSHEWAHARGAVFVEAGNWLRAQWFPIEGETHWRQSVDREVIATRRSVGICDVTTLGKIDIQGRDANLFLNRVYANGFATLAVGRVRYGLMLREDGIAYDDGTTARLGDNHYVMTTTTANAVLVFRQLEFARQCLWPELDVHLISVTDGWAQFAVAGPNSRALLSKLVTEDISNHAFPFMACGDVTLCGKVPGRLFRISFSGELAYEVAVPSRYGNSMMATLMQAGEEFDAVPYGTEALGVMRIEKGHAAGNELNGHTTALNLGLGRMVSQKKDCIGNVLSRREEMNSPDALRLMGFRPVDRGEELSAGAHFFAKGEARNMQNDQGWLSSAAWSPILGHSIGLGFIRDGANRIGGEVIAADPLRGREVTAEIVSPHFLDPEGERLRG
ncbi:MAG: sarcosine oxidase subunit alpha family protein [Rhodobacteraceae bacterium]|nr:sarcosine oxidase subunit alpha family protein [Paracoccaceae bacterium]